MVRTLAVLAVLGCATSASALTIADAQIAKGAVQVKGKGAAPNAPLTWNGAAVGESTKSGAFKFATTTVPDDCTATVSDGAASAVAVIQGCTRVAPHTPVATVIDANGAALGPYLLDRADVLAADHVLFDSPSGPVAVDLLFPSGTFAPPLEGQRIGADYATPDCSGPPMTRVFDEGPFAGAVIQAEGVANGTAYYRPKVGGAPGTLQSAGYFGLALSLGCDQEYPLTNGVCCCSRCAAGGPYPDVAPMGTIDVSRFVPPLGVELR